MKRTIALLAIVAGAILAGGWVFAVTQHLSLAEGWYFAVTTASTVGYGDITPKTGPGRTVAVVLMLTTIPMLAAAFSRLTSMHVKRHVAGLLEEHHRLIREHIQKLSDEGAARQRERPERPSSPGRHR